MLIAEARTAMLQSTQKLRAIAETGTTRIVHEQIGFDSATVWSPGRAVHVPPSRQARSPDPGAVGFAKWLEAVERALRD